MRIGNIYMKTKNYNDAVEAYSKALTEDRTASTLNLLKKVIFYNNIKKNIKSLG